jgi:pilus assembly protein Flp/PilA
MRFKAFLQAFQRDERGVSALEYAILAAIVVAAVAGLSSTISDLYTTTFASVSTKIQSAISK